MLQKLKESHFFYPLKSENTEAIFWFSILVLMTVKLFEGDQSFFVQHFGDQFTDQQQLNWYKWLYHHLSSLLIYCLIPMLIIIYGFKRKLSDYGWRIGDWKFGMKATLIAFAILPFIVYNTSLHAEHKEFYTQEFPIELATASVLNFLLWTLTYLPHYIGWEFFFRGYIGFEAKRRYSAIAAIVFQSLLTTLMHIGKPEGETWGAAIGGIYFGLLTYRTKSVLWVILFHLYLGLLNTWFCSL